MKSSSGDAGERPDADHWIAEFRGGDSAAAGKLVEHFYPQLRRMAMARMMREREGHTWQPTALVNELYMELTKVRNLGPAEASANPQSAFLGFVSHLMNRILIRHSRRLSRRMERISIGAAEIPLALEALPESQVIPELMLGRLAAIHPRLRRVVEMRVYEGLTGEEIAERLSCARRTVMRDWTFAREFLVAEYTTGAGR